VCPLPDDQRVLDCQWRAAEHGELPISDLEAMAVRAVKDVSTPAIPESGNVRDLVAKTRRHQQPARADEAPVAQRNAEARRPLLHDVCNRVGEDRAAVSSDLVAPDRKEFPGWQPVPREEPVHVRGGVVARHPRVDHQDTSAGACQDKRCREPGGATSNHDHIELSHGSKMPRATADGNECC